MTSTREIFYNNLTLQSRKWEAYFDIYDRYFAKFVNNTPNVLEIGIAQGGSIEMWYKYFNNAKLYAVDAFKDVVNIKFPFHVDITIGDQADMDFWAAYVKTKPKFDIIIDDGGHDMEQQLNSLISLFPHLASGGVYLIEDVHTSYWPAYSGGFRKPGTCVEVIKGLVDLLNFQHVPDQAPDPKLLEIFKNLSNITFYNSVILLEKLPMVDFEVADSTKSNGPN